VTGATVGTKTAPGRTTLRERVDDLDLTDRLDDVRHHAEDVRDDVLDRAGHVRGDVLDRVEHVRDDVVDRAEKVRDEVKDRVPELLEDLEPAGRKARIAGWEVLRRSIGVLLLLPRLLVRLLGSLPPLVEGAAQQGSELADRSREVASSVPAVKRRRDRRRTRLALWTAGGFALGVLVGWLLGRRRPTEVGYEATRGDTEEQPVPSVNGTSPVAPITPVRE
jgi:hypothetical protein